MTGAEESAGTQKSPCTNVCVLDAGTGWCLGCGRTGPEIAAWGAMDSEARVALKARLPERLRQISGRGVSAVDQG